MPPASPPTIVQPYHIYLAPPKNEAGSSGSGSGSQEEQAAEEPMVFAGLWDVWDGPDGPMHTYTILTTGKRGRGGCRLSALAGCRPWCVG